jgi:hypothetical protein
MLVNQCYDQPDVSSTEAAFVSKAPFLFECYRTPLFSLSQQQFYKRVVQAFEALSERATLSWDASEENCDADLPRVLLPYYP